MKLGLSTSDKPYIWPFLTTGPCQNAGPWKW
jgi:hypothetical protein